MKEFHNEPVTLKASAALNKRIECKSKVHSRHRRWAIYELLRADAAEREIKLSNKRENNQNAINASSGWEPKTNGHEIAQDKMLIIFLAELGWNERIET